MSKMHKTVTCYFCGAQVTYAVGNKYCQLRKLAKGIPVSRRSVVDAGERQWAKARLWFMRPACSKAGCGKAQRAFRKKVRGRGDSEHGRKDDRCVICRKPTGVRLGILCSRPCGVTLARKAMRSHVSFEVK